jgi:nucleoside-diphosphate-sugar epimerase
MKDQMLIARPDDPILITGATGFIGKRVVRSLLDRGFRNLRCLSRPSSTVPPPDGIPAGARVEMLRGNLLSR